VHRDHCHLDFVVLGEDVDLILSTPIEPGRRKEIIEGSRTTVYYSKNAAAAAVV